MSSKKGKIKKTEKKEKKEKKEEKKKDLKPDEIYEMKFKNPKHPNQKFFNSRFTAKWTREEIQKFAQDASNKLKEIAPQAAVFQISLRYEYLTVETWRSGKMTKPGDPVSLWSPSDSDDIEYGKLIGFDIIISRPV